MSNSAKNSKMLANDDDAEAAGGAAPSLTVAAAPAAAAEAMTASHDASQSDCDGSYICDCRLCICGGAVDYPGDLCYECSKYH